MEVIMVVLMSMVVVAHVLERTNESKRRVSFEISRGFGSRESRSSLQARRPWSRRRREIHGDSRAMSSEKER